MSLTNKDLKQIKELIDSSIEANNDKLYSYIDKNNKTIFDFLREQQLALLNYIDKRLENVATKEDISHLPTKEEFYASQAQLADQLKTSEEERVVINHRLTRLESFHSIS